MHTTEWLNRLFRSVIPGIVICLLPSITALAGGGLVLKNDACIFEIDFYSAHFTAYQPETRGNEQFCQSLPDTGETLFVFDYLHPSLKEVPVSLRIIHDVTDQGDFVKIKHVEEIADIDSHTVFYQAPVIRSDASFQADFELQDEGRYIGIVTAGHPSNSNTYKAVFPFSVGGPDVNIILPLILLFLSVGLVFLSRWSRRRKAPATHEIGR